MSCECPRQGRKRRRASKACISLIFLLATGDRANAFHGRMQREDDHAAPERRRGASIQSSLQLFLQRGASKWGDYVSTSSKSKDRTRTASTSSMKKSSSLYISQLHQQMQNVRSKNGPKGQHIDISGLNMDDTEEEGLVPQEHFTEEILAYVLGGVTAGSAFAAATAGAFFGTAVMALGAIATVAFTGEEEEVVYSLMDKDDSSSGEYVHASKNNIAEQTLGDEGCDFNGEDQSESVEEEKRLPIEEEHRTHVLDSFMLEELKKCYNGIPDYSALSFPHHGHKDICIVDGSDSEVIHGAITEQELLNADKIDLSPDKSKPDLASAIEDVCTSSEDCNILTPTVEDAVPKRVEVVWHDAYAGINIAHYFTNTQSTKNNGERPRNQSQPRRAASKPDPRISAGATRTKQQSTDEHWAVLTDAERDGALLLSESFRVASSAIGLVANLVRFSGETAAAATGGTAKLVGGAVRVSGWAIGSLGEAIENGGNRGGDENGNLISGPSKEDNPERNKMRKRQVAGTSVRLIGDAIEQVADSLLLAGSATERVAFAAAGAAEGTIRIVEDFASFLSDMFSKEGRRGSDVPISPPFGEDESIETTTLANQDMKPNVVEGEVVALADTNNMTEQTSGIAQSNDKRVDEELLDFVGKLSSWAIYNSDIILAETAGVPSLAAESLGVLLLCFLASIALLSWKKNEPCPVESTKRIKESHQCEGDERPMNISFHDDQHKSSAMNQQDHDSHSTLTAESTMKTGPHSTGGGAKPKQTSVARLVAGTFLSFLLLPLKLARVIFVKSWSLTFSKEALLLILYMLGWIFLSRVSQYKSSVIQRKSELHGYKLAIESIGKSTASVSEPAVWLNTILYKLWRVEGGGLEPLLSSSASSLLAESLERPYQKPSVVAHVALDAFTFGSSPPIISRVEVKGVSDDQSVVFLEIDVGMLLQDAILLLDIKPSALEYRSLPSTKVSINSLDARATLSVSLKCSPDYPYVSFLDISLAEIPDFNLRIEPQSESGLKGIDFGSFPVVSKWIKSSITASLSEYLSPQYISVDILAWLKGKDKIVTYYES